MKTSIRISISKDDVSSGLCLANICADILLHIPAACTIMETLSVVETDGIYNIEPGVIIDLYGTSKKIIETKIWPALKTRFPSLECAHIDDGVSFQGCIYDYLRPSVCPENLRKAERAALEGPNKSQVILQDDIDLECGCGKK